MSRAVLLETLLQRAGWAEAARFPLPGDASFRRYIRLQRADGKTAMLMDAPPPEDVRPFCAVAAHLEALGLSVPRRLAADPEAGLLLLEDFGDATFTRLLAAGEDEEALYRLGIEALVALHRHPAAGGLAVPAYDVRRLLAEVALLPDWYVPEVIPGGWSVAERAQYDALWCAALAHLADQPQTLVLRDFHVDNLMRLDGRAGVAACGLLDFQDAVLGPLAYDVMSLLEDARRDIAPALRDTMRAQYGAALPVTDWAEFNRSWAILAAQRHAKVIGIFTRLWRRDGKPVYLRHLPRVLGLLEQALAADPCLAPLQAWFDEHLPRAVRRGLEEPA